MYGTGLFQGLWITFKHYWGKNITIQYPEQMPFLRERFRGHLQYDQEKCIACGMCVKACPNNVLTLVEAKDNNSKKKKMQSFKIDHQYCMFCNLCVEVCPVSCLYFNHDFELSQYLRENIQAVYHSNGSFGDKGIESRLDNNEKTEGGETSESS